MKYLCRKSQNKPKKQKKTKQAKLIALMIYFDVIFGYLNASTLIDVSFFV
jgi:hypothetical protein